ncbi:MAG: hypothetical protein BA864_04530 [Desulfuromonadales bacterium C00003093]|nr:MAG: hypothetical protein BA864_04530 [Desulfuromonadales bacterium C00003093]
MMGNSDIVKHREFLKDNLRLQINFHLTDQNQEVSVLINAEIAEKEHKSGPNSRICSRLMDSPTAFWRH